MGEIIVVRSLTDSDLGIFAAHRATTRSKQRAININAPAAARILSSRVYEQGRTTLDCIVTFGDFHERSARCFSKVHKNWRLGGNKIEGLSFARVDSADFMLMRSVEGNDGTAPVSIAFVARADDPAMHARIAGLVAYKLKSSVHVYEEYDQDFAVVTAGCPAPPRPTKPVIIRRSATPQTAQVVPPMPAEATEKRRPRTIREKVRSATLIEQMLKVSCDLSAPAQLAFLDTVEQLASQLRMVLLRTGGIVCLKKDHSSLWKRIAGQQIGFVDGGMANLAMVGAAPVAVRVGGYVVRPGDRSPQREHFNVLKKLISELYAGPDGGIYDGSFPDSGALRDAARICVEAAGGVRLLHDYRGMRYVFLHGALVSPVSRYTDVMKDGKTLHGFPNFSRSALKELLPGEIPGSARESNFISVYLRELETLATSETIVAGVVERESHTTSVIQAVLNNLNDEDIRPLLPTPPAQWKAWFRGAIDPGSSENGEGPRITDPLLFRCVLEPGEILSPLPINRNDLRRAPEAWKDKIVQYPQPYVSYLQVMEWSAPIRIELFKKDTPRFLDIAELVLHCALLLPRYAFPVGLDIVDKFAHIPDWMSRPVNTLTAVQALKRALDQGDTKLFDVLRRLLCGSEREWILRPRSM